VASRTGEFSGDGGGGGGERSVGVQTAGKLVLLKGLTVTLHAKEDSADDLVIKACLSGEGQEEEIGQDYGWLG
jgi:hypothetical protein